MEIFLTLSGFGLVFSTFGMALVFRITNKA
jgi:hypothetical protein